jgi:hypothetical protein
MPHVHLSEGTFRRLVAKADALGISVEDLVQPVLDRLAETGSSPPERPPPLAGEAWYAELAAWRRDAESRAGRYPLISCSRTAVRPIAEPVEAGIEDDS